MIAFKLVMCSIFIVITSIVFAMEKRDQSRPRWNCMGERCIADLDSPMFNMPNIKQYIKQYRESNPLLGTINQSRPTIICMGDRPVVVDPSAPMFKMPNAIEKVISILRRN